MRTMSHRTEHNNRQNDSGFGSLRFQGPSEEAEEGPSQLEPSTSQVPEQEEGE